MIISSFLALKTQSGPAHSAACFGEEGLREIAQVAQVAVVTVRPIIGKSVAVVALFAFARFAAVFLTMLSRSCWNSSACACRWK